MLFVFGTNEKHHGKSGILQDQPQVVITEYINARGLSVSAQIPLKCLYLKFPVFRGILLF